MRAKRAARHPFYFNPQTVGKNIFFMTFPRYQGLDAIRVVASFGVVFLHIFVAAGSPPALERLMKFRDFALPFLVMSAFFLLTVSLARKPEFVFRDFFRRRVRRLWIPLAIWTFVYSLLAAYFFPAMLGAETSGAMPDPIVFLTGYRHLWFLQFVFLGSLIIYPLVSRLIEKREQFSTRLSVLCFGAAILYGISFWLFLKNHTDWDSFSPESDISLRIFVSQAGSYVLYIPVAVGLGLIADKINRLFERAVFRRLWLAFVLTTMILHVAANNVLWTREIYGVAVFIAALQPWGKISFDWWRLLAAYSYPIYILHFIGAQLLWIWVFNKNLELGGAAVLSIAAIVYFASFAAAVSIRKLFPADWLMPLVAVGAEQNREAQKKYEFESPIFGLLKTQPVLRENAGEK